MISRREGLDLDLIPVMTAGTCCCWRTCSPVSQSDDEWCHDVNSMVIGIKSIGDHLARVAS